MAGDVDPGILDLGERVGECVCTIREGRPRLRISSFGPPAIWPFNIIFHLVS